VRWRSRRHDAAENLKLHEDVDALKRQLEILTELVDRQKLDGNSRWERLFSELELDRDFAEIFWETRRHDSDESDIARSGLEQLRGSEAYAEAFSDPNPLVTVRIASYRKTRELIEVAIASVLRQTHQNFEIVVVNDGPNRETRAAIEKLGDHRIRYTEFAERAAYPRHPHLRWMVAGSPGMNAGVQMARGSWIAPLDDDDEFTPDHIEKLLRLAQDNRAELAYGALHRIDVDTGEEQVIFSSPPAISQFSFQGSLYMTALSFMSYDTQSWRMREPGDWNLIRRMTEAGVKFASTRDVVGTVYSSVYSRNHDDKT